MLIVVSLETVLVELMVLFGILVVLVLLLGVQILPLVCNLLHHFWWCQPRVRATRALVFLKDQVARLWLLRRVGVHHLLRLLLCNGGGECLFEALDVNVAQSEDARKMCLDRAVESLEHVARNERSDALDVAPLS